MKLLLLVLSLSSSMLGQNQYGASKATTLSGAAEVVTIQANAAANTRLAKAILFTDFDVYCSVACDITLERDGSAATATTLTPYKIAKQLQNPTALAYSGSDVGTGTVIGKYTVAAGGTISVSLSGKGLLSGVENLTIRSSSITGDIKINVHWNEYTQ